MIQSMCIQSGELVIILGDKIYFRGKFFKSLRFRIMLLLIVIGIIPCIVVGQGIISNYEKRAVSVRTAEIQNQSTMLGSRLGKAGYLKGVPSETLDAELAQLADIYSGRILLIDDEFQVVKDTYDMEEGKTIISEAVMECYEGNNTSEYDSKNHYIEVTQAIQDPNSGQTEGIMLVSVSTDSVVDSVDVLHSKAVAVEIAVGVVIITISFFVSALLVRPFGRITQAIGAVTEGYDTDNLHENAYTETMLISDAFNKMLGRLKILDDSRQEFVSNVSHELKTPLTSMKVLADSLLAQEGAPAELYQEFMEDIAAEIERENKIINDLLSLVKLDKTSADLNIKSENINDLLELILKRLRPIAVQHNIEVVFESFRPVIAEVDEVKLTLAISNLVENAIPIKARAIPPIFRHSSGDFSTPNNPSTSITYATINCAITIRSAAFAGPSCSILLITVHVIPAPIAPPSSIYFGSTFPSAITLSLPAISHATRQTAKAENCTQPLDTHIPVVFVTCVLKTPCTLISAPESNAIKNPVIGLPPRMIRHFFVTSISFQCIQ